MTYPPQDPYQRDDGRGGVVPHRADSDSDSDSSGASTSPQAGTAPNWESPPSAPYISAPPSGPYIVPSSLSHRPQQVQPHTTTHWGQEPTYHRQPDYLPPGAYPDRGSGYDRTQFAGQQPYDTAFTSRTQYRSPSFQDRQQDYGTSQQQYSAQYSQQHAQQAYPPRHSQEQQYSAQYSQQQAYPPPHSQEQQYSAQYPQQQDRTYYSGQVATMGSQGGANYGGSYPSGGYANVNYQSYPPPLAGSTAGSGGGSGMGGGANVAIHSRRRRIYARGYDDGGEAEEDYPVGSPGSPPVGGLIRCRRCGATYPPQRSCPRC